MEEINSNDCDSKENINPNMLRKRFVKALSKKNEFNQRNNITESFCGKPLEFNSSPF